MTESGKPRLSSARTPSTVSMVAGNRNKKRCADLLPGRSRPERISASRESRMRGPTFKLPAFNLPHVHLVDTAPRGVGEINERGVVHEGVEYSYGPLTVGYRINRPTTTSAQCLV